MGFKRILFSLFIVFFLSFAVFSSEEGGSSFFSTKESPSTIKSVRVGVYPKKIRVVFDLDGLGFYSYSSGEAGLSLIFLNSKKSSEVKNYISVNDWALGSVQVEEKGDAVIFRFPTEYPLSSSIFPLSNPSRLVIDFDKTFTKVVNRKKIKDGLEFYHIVKGEGSDFVKVAVLEADPLKVDIFPSLGKPSQNFVESFTSIINPWSHKKNIGFYKATISNIVSQNSGLAGINGTYFASSGRPLGVFMADGKLVSYPISDRTSLILTKDKKAYIDNIMMDAYFKIGDIKYTITGINEPRSSKNDVIIYTPFYGEITNADNSGYDFTVENGKISYVTAGNSYIPENGFVISAGALYAEVLPSAAKVGEKVEVVINVIPYSTLVKGELLHLVGGGPRLIKSGRVYISKYEEKFRSDITNGRAARTAVGITSDNKIIFLAVNGKMRAKNGSSSQSVGMTLTELAYFMQSLDIKDALNLDGGGSTTMVVQNEIVNAPVDGAQRRVSNGIIIR